MGIKDQLSKLKDMLEIVKTTESILEGQNTDRESDNQDNVCLHTTKSDNLKRTINRTNSESNSSQRMENVTSGNSANVLTVAEKQVNKSSMDTNTRDRLKLQVELQEKRKELEELMFKHKATSSNLNQDVRRENKTDHLNSQFESDMDNWRNHIYNVPSCDRQSR